MAIGSAERSVGLEIDTGTARAVEASGNARSPKIINMAETGLPTGAVEEGMVVQPREVGYSLRNLWNSRAIRHNRVLLGISNQGVLVRFTTVPKAPPDKLGNVVSFHAQELLPLSLDAVVMDYTVIGEGTDPEGNPILEILLVAARRDMLNNFLEALEVAGLEPEDIDVSTLALRRILPEAAINRTVGVINVANGFSSILVVDRGEPRLARLVSIKLADLASELGSSLEAVLNEAAVDSGDRRAKVTSWANNLIYEARSSLTYYQGQENANDIEALVLNGRGARLPGINSRLEEALTLPVRVVNPFSGFANADKFEGSGLKAVDYAISAGLARRGLEG